MSGSLLLYLLLLPNSSRWLRRKKDGLTDGPNESKNEMIN